MTEWLSSTWGEVTAIVTLFATLCSFIRLATKDFDNDFSAEKRTDFARALRGFGPSNAAQWMPNFVAVFDKVFSEKHFSLRCFFMCSLVSIASFTIVIFLFAANEGDFSKLITPENLSGIAVWAIVINLIPDYFSTYQTRLILNTEWAIWKKLVSDTLLTFLLITLWLLPWCFSQYSSIYSIFASENDFRDFGLLDAYMHIAQAMPDVFQRMFSSINMFDFSVGAMIMQVQFMVAVVTITSFSTSIWLWLHAISFYTIKCLIPFPIIINSLNVDKTPVRAIGVVINFYLVALAAICILFSVILN